MEKSTSGFKKITDQELEGIKEEIRVSSIALANKLKPLLDNAKAGYESEYESLKYLLAKEGLASTDKYLEFYIWRHEYLYPNDSGEEVLKRKVSEAEFNHYSSWKRSRLFGLNPEKALQMIEPALVERFLILEKKAIDKEGRFSSAIRCASWCELLEEKKYLKTDKSRRRIQLSEFAKTRYNCDITSALEDKRKEARSNHKKKIIKGQATLSSIFKQ